MTISRSLRIIPFCILLYWGKLFAQEQDALEAESLADLQVLLESVRENNPNLRASLLEAEAMGFRRSQVSKLPDPRIGITYQPYPLYTARGTQRTQWRVEQAVPFPGKLELMGDVADLGAEIASYEALTYEQDLVLEAKRSYYELYRIQQQERLVQAFQNRLKDFEENAATQYVVGTGMQQAVLKAQLERNALSQRQFTLDLQRRSAIEMIARLVNKPVSEIPIGEIQTPPIPSIDDETLLEIARRFRPEVKALDAADRRTTAQIALAEKEFYPDFGFNLTYFDVGRASIPPTATGRDALAIGVMVNIPIHRGRIRAQVMEARTRNAQVRARIEGLDTAFRTQIADLISQLTQEREQLTLFEEALIPQAEASLQSTLSAYTTGRTGFLDLLDAERMLFSLNTGYEDAFARYLKAAAALERALGITMLSELDSL